MFRRIELILDIGEDAYNTLIRATAQHSGISEDEVRQTLARFQKFGIMAVGNDAVWEAWGDMPIPHRSIGKNCRFYFTEEGWRRYGRATITACQQTGQAYRVLRTKENAVEVIYRDEIQVAVRPRKPRRHTYE